MKWTRKLKISDLRGNWMAGYVALVLLTLAFGLSCQWVGAWQLALAFLTLGFVELLVGASWCGMRLLRAKPDDALREAARRLERERAQLEAVFQVVSEGIVVCDMAGNFILVNDAEAKTTGYATSQEMEQNLAHFQEVFELSYPDGRALSHDEWPIARALRGERINELHVCGRRRDTGQAWCYSCSTQPVYDDSGNQVLVVVITRDITERERVESTLKERERQYRTLTENAPEVIARFDRELRHCYINDYGAKVYGLAKEEVIGKTNAELGMPADMVAYTKEHFEQVLATGLQQTVDFDFESPSFGHQYLSSLFVPEFDDKGERIESILAITRDVTPLRHAQKALRESEMRFREAFDHAPVGMVITDLEGRFLHVNEAYCRITGYQREELLHRTVDYLKLTHPDDVKENKKAMARLIAGKIPAFFVEKRYIRKDGQVVWVRVSAALHRESDGRTFQVVGLVEDITSRVQAQQEVRRVNEELLRARDRALEASQAKSRFLANMSHELRTPLNAIIGYSEMLEEEVQEAGQVSVAQDLVKIRTAGRHLLELISGVLDLSKIEAGRMTLNLGWFDLPQMVENVAGTARPLAEKNANRFSVSVDPRLGNMYGDEVKVRQVLYNLVSNAAKFTRGGEVRLEAQLQSAPRQSWIVFRVADTGVGIPAQEQERIFGAFHQVRGSTAEIHTGTGLGLAIARQFCQMMGGEITLQSEPGKGSVFTVRFPREIRAQAGA